MLHLGLFQKRLMMEPNELFGQGFRVGGDFMKASLAKFWAVTYEIIIDLCIFSLKQYPIMQAI